MHINGINYYVKKYSIFKLFFKIKIRTKTQIYKKKYNSKYYIKIKWKKNELMVQWS